MADQKEKGEFPLGDARKLIMDLAKENPVIYWVDFLTSVSIGWAAFVLTLIAPVAPIVRVLLAVLSSFALYRAMIFIHELAHIRRGGLKVFRVVWNLLSGFPMMLPSFAYKGVHNEHHIRTIYGTADDGEYWPFVCEKPYQIVGFPILSFALPIYYAVRFIVVTPFLVFSKKLRNYVWQWFSSLAIIMKYKRPLPSSKKEARAWVVQEWGACLYGITVVVLIILGVLPYTVLILWYGISAFAFFMNSFRTLAAHAYRSPGEEPMTQAEQFLDSVNVPGFLFVPALWAPVGLRYHATHHLFPLMPYHALGKAHRRLAKQLPADSRYFETLRSSLWSALRQLWRETAA